MFSLRQSLFLAATASTGILTERSLTVMIEDPGRKLLVTFLLALAGVIISWIAFLLRYYYERIEELTRREDRAALIIAATQTPRLHSVEQN